MTVRTRFAPSPTGFLHIGGVRTALFNWLFTRRHGGQFLLRIDDTDQQRNVEAALAPILHGFRWLGIDWDEGPDKGGPHAPYYQSQRLAHYQAAVDRLLASGHAYHDYARTEEIAAERETAEREKRAFLYSRRWMAETASDRVRFENEGRSAVVRLKMPRAGTLVIDDQVRGQVEFEWAREQDHVIQRTDGTCLYHLASVVDDHDFEITHVIRAEEHLSNTPRQIFILESLGYKRPFYAHLPYVAEPGSKTKLSKRKLDKYLKNRDFAQVYEHGRAIAVALGLQPAADTFNPVIVDFYEQVGYLPDAIINYLALLGWSLDERTEFFTRQQMIDNFSLERVNKAPASFDPKKLWSFQDQYMQRLPIDEKLAMTLPYLERAGVIAAPASDEIRLLLGSVVTAAGDRIKVAGDILDYEYLFVTDHQVAFEEAAIESGLGRFNAARILRDVQDELRTRQSASEDEQRYSRTEHSPVGPESGGPLTVDWLEKVVIPRVARRAARGISDVVKILRAALTGKQTGIGIYETMVILERAECIARMDRAIAKVPSPSVRDLLTGIPEAIAPAYVQNENESRILIYSGPMSVEADGRTSRGPGEMTVEWRPSPSVRFSMTAERFPPLPLAPGRLTLLGIATDLPVHINRVQIGDDVQIAGRPVGKLATGDASALAALKFHLVNFHDYLGTGIRSGTSAWAGRLNFDAGEFEITLDALQDTDKRLRAAADSGGHTISHVGVLRRKDSAIFSGDEAERIITAAHFFFSFVRGLWVGPVLLVGADDTGADVWRDYTSRRCDASAAVGSWCPVHKMSGVTEMFHTFLERWNEERRLLQAAIYYYVSSNTCGASDVGLVTSIMALHALGTEYTSQKFPDGPGSAEWSRRVVDAVVTNAQVPSEVPAQLESLRQIAGNDGPLAISKLSAAHYLGEISDEMFQEDRVHSLYEAWNLAQFYVELALLRRLGYEGRVQNRTTLKWRGDTDAVPWAK